MAKKKNVETVPVIADDEFDVACFREEINTVIEMNDLNIKSLSNIDTSAINPKLKDVINNNLGTLEEWSAELTSILKTLEDEKYASENISVSDISTIITLEQKVIGIGMENKVLTANMLSIVQGNKDATKS